MWIRVAFATMLMVVWVAVVLLDLPVGLALAITALGALRAWAWRVQNRRATLAAADLIEQALVPTALGTVNQPHTRLAAVLQQFKSIDLNTPAALVELPLYIAVGASHSGVRTWLRHSGLTWLADEPFVAAGCTWWIAKECIVMTPAAGTSTRAMLDTLRRHRPQAPVNGFVLTLSAADLLSTPLNALQKQATAMRQEVSVLQDSLQVKAPLYLVVTQCDRLTGFVDTFSHLPKSALQNVLGRTWGTHTAPQEQVASQLDNLIVSVTQETLPLMQMVRDTSSRERIYQFAEVLGTLRTPLLTWANEFFPGTRRGSVPRLRGFFLCSAANDGEVPAFTQRIFAQGILPDRAQPTGITALMPSPVAMRAAVAAALVLVALPMAASVKNKHYLHTSQNVVADAVTQRALQNPVTSLATLDAMRDQVDRLTAAEDGTSYLNEQSGMSQTTVLLQSVRALYVQTIRDAVLAPIVAADAQQMILFVRQHKADGEPVSEREFKLYFDLLRKQLLLSGAYDKNDHTLDDTDSVWLTEVLSHRWQRAMGADARAAALASTRKHLAYYLAALPEEPALRLSRNLEAIAETRLVLEHTDPTTILLSQALDGADAYAIPLAQVTGTSGITALDNVFMAGGFTRQGWENVVQGRLANLAEHNNNWVLGRRAMEHLEPYLEPTAIAQLTTTYWARYVDGWWDFVGSIRVAASSNTQHAAPVLQRLQQTLLYNLEPIHAVASPSADTSTNDALLMAARQAVREQLQASAATP